MPDFFVRVREQVCDLVFKRSRIDDFAQRSVRCQGQQISRDIKSPRPQGAVVAFLLHLRGLRRDAHEITKHLLGERVERSWPSHRCSSATAMAARIESFSIARAMCARSAIERWPY